MLRTIIGFLILLSPNLAFGQLTKEQKAALNQPRTWAAVVAKDGEAKPEANYNYLFIGDTKDAIKRDSVWFWVCTKQPCRLFTKGAEIKIDFPNGQKERNIRVGREIKKGLIGELCDSQGCFEAAFIHSEKLE
jgi:hypothetical protein